MLRLSQEDRKMLYAIRKMMEIEFERISGDRVKVSPELAIHLVIRERYKETHLRLTQGKHKDEYKDRMEALQLCIDYIEETGGF